MEDLGPAWFTLKDPKTGENIQIKRTDMQLKSPQDKVMECSHFERIGDGKSKENDPCVIYLHGNSACRLEALPLLDIIMPKGMSLFTFDSVGSGKSEGDWVSLGWHERDDLEVVVEHLRK